MFAAAALTIAAGSATAQVLKAEIPFAFRAQSVRMAPGSYTVSVLHLMSSTRFVLSNVDDGRSVILPSAIPGDASKAVQAAGVPRLSFECVGHDCVLRSLWPAIDRTAYRFPGPRPAGDDPVSVAEVRLTPLKSE
jgi:hypothetical protein